MTTRDISTLLFNSVYLYVGSPSNCCIAGFHSYDLEPGDAKNGNRERRFVMNFSNWNSPCLRACTMILALVALAGCDVERRKSDAELGLNPQQAISARRSGHCTGPASLAEGAPRARPRRH